MKKIAYSVASILGLLPVAAFAQQYTVQTGFVDSVINLISKLISFAFPTLTAIAVLIFIYTVIQYILSDKKEEKKKDILYALVGLFVILALFGIINVLKNITGTQGNNTIDASSVPRVDLSY